MERTPLLQFVGPTLTLAVSVAGHAVTAYETECSSLLLALEWQSELPDGWNNQRSAIA